MRLSGFSVAIPVPCHIEWKCVSNLNRTRVTSLLISCLVCCNIVVAVGGEGGLCMRLILCPVSL